jgi:hypothetical protein
MNTAGKNYLVSFESLNNVPNMPILKNLPTTLLLLTILVAPCFAQRVQVTGGSRSVKDEKIEGYEASLVGATNEISNALNKYLKAIGKPKQSGQTITVSEPTLHGIQYGNPIAAIVKDDGLSTLVWLGMSPNGLSKEQQGDVKKELEKTLYDFGVQFYRTKIQVQVDESTRAVQAVDKQQQKLINEGKALSVKLEDRKREKLQLEKSLESNKAEQDMLLKKIEQNKHQQDSIAIAAQQVKKVMDMHKEKQRKIN